MADPAASATLPQFDVMRRRLQSQTDLKKQQQEEDIKRQYAANGMLQSGAYLKAQEQGAKNLNDTSQQAQEQIDFQQAQEQQRQADIQNAQKYQTGEREATQAYATGERKDQQLFNKDLFDQDLKFKQMVQSQNFGLATQEMAESKKANFANFAIALKTAGFSPEDMTNIFNQAGDVYSRINTNGSGAPSLNGGGTSYTPRETPTPQVDTSFGGLSGAYGSDGARLLQQLGPSLPAFLASTQGRSPQEVLWLARARIGR